MGIRKPIFLIDGGQSIQVVTDTLVKFINGAKRSLHIAIFDFRLGDPATVRRITGALNAESAALSAFYETDFQELWAGGKVAGTGVNDFGKVTRDGLNLDVAFSPGEGRRIDHEIANLILDARESIHIASMVITSDAILQAL